VVSISARGVFQTTPNATDWPQCKTTARSCLTIYGTRSSSVRLWPRCTAGTCNWW